jgi:predicted metal-dependent hydrolase
MSSLPTKNRIPVRRMDFDFLEAELPKYWFEGKMLATHMSNALNLIFPKGERFFVRSVKYYEDQIDDEILLKDIKAFYGQEGSHSREHERFFEALWQHDFDTDRFMKIYQTLGYDFLESKMPPKLNLAVTAALEHFTAMFATGALSNGHLDQAHPIMRDLLRWHAAEEIEHKAVAFDVLQTVDDRYHIRIAGLILAMASLSIFWTLGTVMLVAQEPKGFRRGLLALYKGVRQDRILDGKMREAFKDYWRRDFHPNDIDNRGLAEAYLKKIGRALA